MNVLVCSLVLLVQYERVRLVEGERETDIRIETNMTRKWAFGEEPPWKSHGAAANSTKTMQDQNEQERSKPGRKVVRLLIMKEPPFVEYHNISNGQIVTCSKTGPGVVVELLDQVRQILDLQFEYQEAPMGAWGEEIQPGVWSGVIGQLQRKEIDMVAAPAIMSYARIPAIDQSYPFYTSETGIMIKTPSRFLENRFLIVTAPFKWQVWAVSALVIFVSGCVMKTLCRSLRMVSEVQYSWSESVWIFFSVFVQQGLPVQPQSWTCRTMLAFWWLAALTLVATFTGNMVALFAVNKAAFPINSAEDLLARVRNDGYKVIMQNNNIRIKYLRESGLEVFQQLWYEMSVKRKWINVSALEEGIKLVREQPNLVLLGPMDTLNFHASSDCAVATSSNGIMPVLYTIALQKESPYTNTVSNVSRKLVETGVISKWIKDYHFSLSAARGNFCIFVEGASAAGEAIGLGRAQGAFWILFAGAVLGLTGMLMENTARMILPVLKETVVGLLASTGFSCGRQEIQMRKYSKQTNDGQNEAHAPALRSYSTVRCGGQSTPVVECAAVYQPGFNEYNTVKNRKKVCDGRGA